MAKLCRMHAISGRHGHVQPARTLKPGLALKPINRDRMNQPKPLLTFQGNHRLPFHCEPGTPFRMVYARQQLAKAAGRMVNLLLETWRCFYDFSSGCDLLYTGTTNHLQLHHAWKNKGFDKMRVVWCDNFTETETCLVCCPLFGHAFKIWKTAFPKKLSYVCKSWLPGSFL